MQPIGTGKTILYSLLPLILLATVLEGTFRIVEIWLPPLPVDYGWGFNADSRLFVPDAKTPGALETAEAKKGIFQEQYFKMPKSANAFRVFFVGGSSVNYAKDDLFKLAVRLTPRYANKCHFEFIDAGGCGYGTHRLVPIVAEVLEYQPDLIVFYEAHNEFEEYEQLQFVRLSTLPLQRIVYKSAFCRFIRDRVASWQLNDLRRKRNQEILRMTPKDNGSWDVKTFTEAQIEERMKIFEQNLTLMISLCKARNVPLILSSVPSNLCKPRLNDEAEAARIHAYFERGEYEEGAKIAREVIKHTTRHQASDTENAIIRRIARENDIPLADVEAKVIAAEPHHIPGETLFEDWCHLNYKGRVPMMEAFEEQIVKILDAKYR